MVCGKMVIRPVFSIAILLAVFAALAVRAFAEEKPKHKSPPPKKGGTVVTLCDGETTVELDVKPGEEVPRDKAQGAADALMSEWRKKNPQANWEDAPVLVAQNAPAQKGASQTSPRSPPQVPTAPTAPSRSPDVGAKGPTAASGGQEVRESAVPVQAGQTYGAFSDRDRLIWQASVDQEVEEGNRIFHDVKRLGGTTGISCDMCHPNAANTHPETYPKYQVQLGRVALLRDMINWCIENPVRGKPIADDSPEMRALESFILAQRKGVALDYGKH